MQPDQWLARTVRKISQWCRSHCPDRTEAAWRVLDKSHPQHGRLVFASKRFGNWEDSASET